MTLAGYSFFETTTTCANCVDEVLSSLYEREEDSVPAMSDVWLDCRCKLSLLVICAFLLEFLEDDVAELLQFNGVV